MNDRIIENIKEFIPSSDRYEYAEAIRLSARLLDPDELKEILSGLDKDALGNYRYWDVYSILHAELDKSVDRRQYKEKLGMELRHRNDSVKSLLNRFNDKKSGKVIESRKELQKRFFFLSYREQVTVIMSFLKGGKTDRIWCFDALRKWWSEDLKEAVMTVWNEFHEERCGWLLVRYFPVSTLRSNLAMLDYDSNYYQLCKRLVKENFFTVDSKRLRNLTSDSKYLWIMSQTHDGISVREAEEIIFGRINSAIQASCSAQVGKSVFVSDKNGDCFVIEISAEDICGNFYMHRLHDMDKILSSMCRMGMCHEVMEFLKLDVSIHNDFVKLHKQEIEDIADSDSYSKNEAVKDLYVRYSLYYAKNIPSEYRKTECIWKNGSERRSERKNDVLMSTEDFERLKQERPALKRLVESLELEVSENGDDIPF